MKTCSNCRGFTVVELLISLGVIAILLSTAVPSFTNMVKDNRLTAQLNGIVGDITMARNEATKRDTRIILCRSADPYLGTPACGGTAQDWSSGYLVFTGADGNNTYQAGTDTLLTRGLPAMADIEMLTSSNWNETIEINPTGSLNASGTVTMALCDERGNTHGRQITISLTGKPRLASGNISNCTP